MDYLDYEGLQRYHELLYNDINDIKDTIEENEEITASALNDLNERVEGKADENHEHASSAISSMTGYEIASSVSPITSADTLNVALGKLEKANLEINALIGSGYADTTITEVIENMDTAIAAALADLNDKVGDVEALLAAI